MTVRTRFAPSPTGYLHIGGVRTALFNWLLARQSGGQFILRIDDTDQKRNQEEALQPILDGFRWLGLDWDEGPEVGGPHGPYFQSQRLDKYQAAVQQLLDSGHAYRDFSTSQEFVAEREAADKAKEQFRYSRKWMAETDQQAAAFEAEGRKSVVRLKMPREGTCEFVDHVRGEMSFEWAAESDHVIQRTDGTSTYHLANVVDDHDFQITHVVRAVEHLSNTPRQIFIAQSLGYPIPQYAHLPFVAEPGSKKKLSKRDIEKYLNNKDFKRLYQSGADIAERIGLQTDPASFNPVLVEFYREAGFLPEAINNYLLLLGWSLDDSTEEFSREEMIEKFSLDRVVKAEASFDAQKLSAFQGRYFEALPMKRKIAMCLPYLQKAGLVSEPPPCDIASVLESVITAAGDRLVMAGDILNFDDFFFPKGHQLDFVEKAFQKRLVKPERAGELLAKCLDVLKATEDWTPENLEVVIKQFCDDQEIGIGDIIHALRVAASGKPSGFGMFDILAILGREESSQRIEQALAKLANT
jgi:glutamyl-tRNA synthetase